MIAAPWGKNTAEEDGAASQCHQPQPSAEVANPPDRSVPPERITVSLIPKARQDLQRLRDQTNLSKTDIVNRAISLYEFVEAQRGMGRDILIRDPDTGETQVVRLM